MRYLVIGLIVGLLVMRLLRTRWAGKLLGISRRALDIAHLVLLTITAVIAVAAEEWVLLAVVGALLIWAIVDLVRARRERADGNARSRDSGRDRHSPARR